MEHDEASCQAPPEGPFLCINNCGFFGSAATMNMCSKCHKDLMLKQDQAKLSASTLGSIMNGSSSSNQKESFVTTASVDVPVSLVEPKITPMHVSPVVVSAGSSEAKPKNGPRRCNSCNKRVGLMGFDCRCGNIFCAIHRYSDKHDCPFDYRTSAQDAIAKANPIVKAEKLDKI
ncbi:zinc finger A20 and AN1 domain-containing stress-associated protein 4-like [Momordica charantia]|uniref:Zinc finger A20 and AN1 domain-containing stress-associated protein 4-like n=1 Tax=Momordica charantia TaxID=3673 RepID=A0A6J1DMQ4_MOMCH|nr:zinc finger A20 and AN1 domain-containing stress-associated protein 4-like [Momordica charantia]